MNLACFQQGRGWSVSKESELLKYYDTLKKIARDYQTPTQLRRNEGQYGLSFTEELEMSYENIQQEAQLAIRGKRRPDKGERK